MQAIVAPLAAYLLSKHQNRWHISLFSTLSHPLAALILLLFLLTKRFELLPVCSELEMMNKKKYSLQIDTHVEGKKRCTWHIYHLVCSLARSYIYSTVYTVLKMWSGSSKQRKRIYNMNQCMYCVTWIEHVIYPFFSFSAIRKDSSIGSVYESERRFFSRIW